MKCCGLGRSLRGPRRKKKSKHSLAQNLHSPASSLAEQHLQNGIASTNAGPTPPQAIGTLRPLHSANSLVSHGSVLSDNAYQDALSDLDDDELGRNSISAFGSSPGPGSASLDSPELSSDEHPHPILSPFAFFFGRRRSSFRSSLSNAQNEDSPPDMIPSDKVHPDNEAASIGRLDIGVAPSGQSAAAVIEQEEAATGCMSILHPFAPPPKRLIRTIKPVAGSSFNRQSPNVGRVDGIECWEEPDARTFMVRGVNYMKDRRKVPSDHSIYRLLGCDIYSFDFKINHISRHIQLPAPPILGAAAYSLPASEQIPPLLIVNIQLPMYPASIFGRSDGEGHSLVYYFGLPEGWDPAMVDNKAVLGMLQRFVHDGTEADGSPTRNRLKLIPRVANVEQWAKDAPLSTPEYKLLVNYNDKPVLTRPQQRFYFGPNYMEVTLDIHAWAYLARKAFSSYIPRLGTVVFENAFVIQGNQEDELPEVVLACARVSRVDFGKVRPFPAQLERAAIEAPRTLLSQRYSAQQGLDNPARTEDKPVVANAM
ncbi:probable protein ENHANCED DISEASE RESISTANCE 2 at C-terminar half [Coccomyxa sp. Obi]|nr:probable protein ENHANCED DISEASE RESISTANCE 2 at C-terminar half [Coccomyxa sp. Obi]